MSEKSDVSYLKKEINELRKTIIDLQETVNELSQKVDTDQANRPATTDSGRYNVFGNQASPIQRDISWERLVKLLIKAGIGLTADELANKWGRSRSRTSEVLNKLVEEGYLIKFRDGRRIKFRAHE
ncbi:MAG: helix-turn-helix domain-containing protein [Candidatus Thorarchaeota archaeon]